MKHSIFIALCAGAFFSQTLVAQAATITWDGGGANNYWSNAVNWSGNTLPGANDDVVFNGTSVKNSNIDGTFLGAVGSVTINAGYTGSISTSRPLAVGGSGGTTGNITINAGTWSLGAQTVSLVGNWLNTGGTLNASTGTVDFNKTGGTQTVTSNGQNFYRLNHSGTSTLQANSTLATNNQFNNTAGIFDLNGQNLSVGGTTNLSNGTVNLSSGTVVLTATATFNGADINGGSSNLTIGALSHSGGTFTAPSGTFNVNGNWTASGGNFIAGAGTVNFISTSPQNLNVPFNFNNVNHSGSGTLNLTGPINVSGDFINSAGTLDANTRLVTVAGDVILSPGCFVGADGGALIMNSSGTQSVQLNGNTVRGFRHIGTGTMTIDGSDVNAIGTVLNSAGVFDMNGRSLTAGGRVTVSGGTFESRGGAHTFNGGLTVSGGIFNGDTGTVDVNGSVILNAGTLQVPNMLLMSGNYTASGGSVSFPPSSAMIMDGASAQRFGGGGFSYQTIYNNNTAGGLELSSDTVVTGLFENNGDFSPLARVWDMTGATFNNNGNVFITDSGANIIGLVQDIDSGTFTLIGNSDGLADTFIVKDFGVTDYYDLVLNITPADALAGENYVSDLPKSIAHNLTITSGIWNFESSLVASPMHVAGATLVNGGTYQPSSTALNEPLLTQTFVGDVTVSAGTFNVEKNALELQSDILLSGGTFQASASVTNLAGDFISTGGTFLASGVFNLVGVAQKLAGTLSFYNLVKNVVLADTLTIDSGAVITILNDLKLTGQIGNLLSLLSSSAGVQARIDPRGTRDVQYLNVQDSFNINATAVTCASGCVDAGNNTNWVFATVGFSTATGSVNETDGNFTLPIMLSNALLAPASVDYSVGPASTAVGGGVDYTLANGTANFAAGATTPTTPVDVTIWDDFLAEGIETVIVLLTGHSANVSLSPISTFTLNINDDETAGFDVNPLVGTTTEAGGTQIIQVRLTSAPTASVTISVASSDITEGIPDVLSLTFDATDWNVYKSIIVTGQDDAIADGNVSYSLILGPDNVTTAVGYNGLDPADVSLSNTDNEVVGLSFGLVTPPLSEAAIVDSSQSLVLFSAPTAAAVVTVSFDSQFSNATPQVFNFDNLNWNVPQNLVLRALDDYLIEGAHSGTVTVSVSSADPAYAALGISFRSYPIIENDFPPTASSSGAGGQFVCPRYYSGTFEVKVFNRDGNKLLLDLQYPQETTDIVLSSTSDFAHTSFIEPANRVEYILADSSVKLLYIHFRNERGCQVAKVLDLSTNLLESGDETINLHGAAELESDSGEATESESETSADKKAFDPSKLMQDWVVGRVENIKTGTKIFDPSKLMQDWVGGKVETIKPGYKVFDPSKLMHDWVVEYVERENTCPVFIRSLAYGSNDMEEIKKMQEFLVEKKFLDEGSFIFGNFEKRTLIAVNEFQLFYKVEVLYPWGISKPTGYWHTLSMKMANKLKGC